MGACSSDKFGSLFMIRHCALLAGQKNGQAGQRIFRGQQLARQFKRATELEPINENVIRSALLFASGLADPNEAIAIGEYGVAGNPCAIPVGAT